MKKHITNINKNLTHTAIKKHKMNVSDNREQKAKTVKVNFLFLFFVYLQKYITLDF